MEPLIESLMTQYGMSRDLAERTAANLSTEGGAKHAYPKANYGPMEKTPAKSERLPPAPPDPPPAEQMKVWLDRKRKEYEDFGAPPDQVEQWLDFKRKQYERFFQSKSNPRPEPQGRQAQPAPMVRRRSAGMQRRTPTTEAAPQVTDTSADELFSTPEAVQYQVAPGQSGFTKDAVTRRLVRDYKVDPEGAVALAGQMRKGAKDYGVQGEALSDVAARETRRLQLMKRYQDIKEAQESGAEVGEADAAWAAKVDARTQELRSAEIGSAARDAKAAQETEAFRRDHDERKVATMRSFRPGMAIGPDQTSLIIPYKLPPSKTAQALMNTLGFDEATATAYAAQLEGR
jgi:hypothetical protein